MGRHERAHGAIRVSVEIVEEGGDALQSGLALSLNLDGEFDLYLADAAQVLDVVQRGGESHPAACDDGHAEAHLVHSIVDHHLQVVHFDNLFPQVGQQRERQIAVGDGALVWAFFFSALHVYVDPLVVEGGVGKFVDAFLVDGEPVAFAEFLTQVGGELLIGVDDKLTHLHIFMFTHTKIGK